MQGRTLCGRHQKEASGADELSLQGVIAKDRREALDCELLFDTGACRDGGGSIRAGGTHGLMAFLNSRISGAVVYTNNPLASAFRGFGVPQAAAGIEQAMDELAKRYRL